MGQKVDKDEQWTQQDFELFGALEALDRKNYGWYNGLTDEQKRKFVPYMLLHWMSAIKGQGLLESFYVLSTDAAANRQMFNEYVGKHPELQWLMLCASSPGTGKQFHQWIPHLPPSVSKLRDKAKQKDVAEYFRKIYKGADAATINEAADVYTKHQHHKVRLAKMYPELKVDDLEVLAKVVSPEDLDDYDRRSGS